MNNYTARDYGILKFGYFILRNAVEELHSKLFVTTVKLSLAEKKIEELEIIVQEDKAKQNMYRDEKNHAIKRWSSISEVNKHLKERLVKYESGNYTLVENCRLDTWYLDELEGL